MGSEDAWNEYIVKANKVHRHRTGTWMKSYFVTLCSFLVDKRTSCKILSMSKSFIVISWNNYFAQESFLPHLPKDFSCKLYCLIVSYSRQHVFFHVFLLMLGIPNPFYRLRPYSICVGEDYKQCSGVQIEQLEYGFWQIPPANINSRLESKKYHKKTF